MSLLETVKNMPYADKRKVVDVNNDMVDVALAWAKREVTIQQIAKAMDILPANAEHKMRHALVSAVRTGKLIKA